MQALLVCDDKRIKVEKEGKEEGRGRREVVGSEDSSGRGVEGGGGEVIASKIKALLDHIFFGGSGKVVRRGGPGEVVWRG